MSAPVLHAVLEAVAGATGAGTAWVTDTRSEAWSIVDAVGADAPMLAGQAWPPGGVVGFVVESDQPAALVPRAGVDLTADVERMLGRRPSAVLVVPCAAEAGTVGALGLADKAGGAPFSFDDLELAALLGPVAGAALVSIRPPDVPDVATLAAGLARLSNGNPARYQRVAAAVAALLDG
jgi:GAF domain-containing protein